MLNRDVPLSAAQVGARGKDEWGAMFASSMKRSSVGISKMRVQQGPTGHTRPWNALLFTDTMHYVHAAWVHGVSSAQTQEQLLYQCHCLILDDLCSTSATAKVVMATCSLVCYCCLLTCCCQNARLACTWFVC